MARPNFHGSKYFRAVKYFQPCWSKTDTSSNNVDPDGTARKEPSHQDLHCLSFCLFIYLFIIIIIIIIIILDWNPIYINVHVQNKRTEESTEESQGYKDCFADW